MDAQKLYNALTVYFDAVDLAILVSNHSFSELEKILIAKKEEISKKNKSPYQARWVTKDLMRTTGKTGKLRR